MMFNIVAYVAKGAKNGNLLKVIGKSSGSYLYLTHIKVSHTVYFDLSPFHHNSAVCFIDIIIRVFQFLLPSFIYYLFIFLYIYI